METIRLSPTQVLVLDGATARQLSCVRGRLWISLHGEDICLIAGESWRQPGLGGERLLIEAVGGMAELLLTASAAPPFVTARKHRAALPHG